MKRILEQQERDKRAGIIRPDDDDPVKQESKLLLFPDNSDCEIADAIHIAFLRDISKRRVEYSILAELYPIREATTGNIEAYVFSDPLDDCNTISSEWGKIACSRFSEMNEAQDLYRAVQERMEEIQWISTATSYWHLFLAVALGIRVTKIHAEIRELKAGKLCCRRFKLPRSPRVRLGIFASLFKPRVLRSQQSDVGGNGER